MQQEYEDDNQQNEPDALEADANEPAAEEPAADLKDQKSQMRSSWYNVEDVEGSVPLSTAEEPAADEPMDEPADDEPAAEEPAAEEPESEASDPLEDAAEMVHIEWRKRNPLTDQNASQHVLYAELPAHEKEKDRAHVRAMLKLCLTASQASGSPQPLQDDETRQRLIEECAEELHAIWRKNQERDNGDRVVPHLKETDDGEVDINVSWSDLHPQYQQENRDASAAVAETILTVWPDAIPGAPPPAAPPAAPHVAEPEPDEEYADDTLGSKAVDWPTFMSKLPPLGKDQESKDKRKEIFTQFDVNSNGYLSLAEMDKGIAQILRLDDIFSIKPVMMRAFQAAKDSHKAKGKDDKGDDYVTISEFRLFFVWIRQYYELWQMFDLVDSGDDRRINFSEFSSALPKLEAWGLNTSDPEVSFSECDQNGGGIVLFDEFAAWALKKQLDGQDDDFDDEAFYGDNLPGTIVEEAREDGEAWALPPPVQPSSWGIHSSKANRLPMINESRPSPLRPSPNRLADGTIRQPLWKPVPHKPRARVSDFGEGHGNAVLARLMALDEGRWMGNKGRGKSKDDSYTDSKPESRSSPFLPPLQQRNVSTWRNHVGRLSTGATPFVCSKKQGWSYE